MIGEYTIRLKQYFTVKNHEVLVYRLWSVVVGFFLPVYGLSLVYLLPDSIERIDHRLYLTAMWLFILIGSYFIRIIKKYLPFFCYLANLISLSWVLWIVSINSFSTEYAIGLFLSFSGFSVISRDIMELSFLSIFFTIAVTIAVYCTPVQIVNVAIYALSFLILIFVYILNMLRSQYIKNRLISLNNRLEHKNKELERFVYVASHDLKSPIRTIGSFTSLMKRRLNKEQNSEIQEYMGFIMTGVSRMTEIIEDLLNYSQYGFEQIIFEPVDITHLINEVWIEITGDLDNVELILNNNIPSQILLNRNQIKQLFQNLIENGLKYNELDKKIIKIEYSENRNFHFFTIQDNGIGIDPKYKKKIFEMFQRLHVNDKFGGTGIGLAVCKRIVENHNGFINLKESDTQGSIFEFKISKKLKITNP